MGNIKILWVNKNFNYDEYSMSEISKTNLYLSHPEGMEDTDEGLYSGNLFRFNIQIENNKKFSDLFCVIEVYDYYRFDMLLYSMLLQGEMRELYEDKVQQQYDELFIDVINEINKLYDTPLIDVAHSYQFSPNVAIRYDGKRFTGFDT